jgi:hypothetical protein
LAEALSLLDGFYAMVQQQIDRHTQHCLKRLEQLMVQAMVQLRSIFLIFVDVFFVELMTWEQELLDVTLMQQQELQLMLAVIQGTL